MYARIRLLRAVLREHACVCVWLIEAEGRGRQDRRQRDTRGEKGREREREGFGTDAQRGERINSFEGSIQSGFRFLLWKKFRKFTHPGEAPNFIFS